MAVRLQIFSVVLRPHPCPDSTAHAAMTKSLTKFLKAVRGVGLLPLRKSKEANVGPSFILCKCVV